MPSLPVPKALVIVMLVAALVGFADSSYLTAQHVRGVVPPCVLDRCEQVLTSQYATIVGVPLAAFGMFYYGAILVLLVAFLDTAGRRLVHATCWLTSVGFLASLYFVFVQAFLIKAWCPYCLISALTSTLLFAVAVRIMRID